MDQAAVRQRRERTGATPEEPRKTASRPHLLFLAQCLPYPLDTGVAIRTHHILRHLAREFRVTALCFHRDGEEASAAERAEGLEILRRYGDVESFTIPQSSDRLRFLLDHLWSLLAGRVFTHHMYRSRDYAAALRRVLGTADVDLVHVDSLDLVRYLPAVDRLPVACTHHNIESELLRRRAEAEESRWRRAYVARQARLQEREERRWAPRVDLNVVVSARDGDRLSSLASGSETAVVPNGVDTERFRPSRGEKEGLVSVGGTTWFPNRDALRYYVEEIRPRLATNGRKPRLTWIGSTTDEMRRELGGHPDIRLTGRVEDIRPEVLRAACFVVPLRVGGGTRLKILTAWALGKAVVSTSVGCEGLAAEDGDNILVRDEPGAFARAVTRVLEDPQLRERLGREGRRTVERLYSWEEIGTHIRGLYRELVGAGGGSRLAAGRPD